MPRRTLLPYPLVLLLVLTVPKQGGCELFTVEWSVQGVRNYNHSLDTMLADTIRVMCPPGRFDNIVYLPTLEQLQKCNASVLEGGADTPTHLAVGSCSVGGTSFFDIDIKRTSGTLASAVPFQNGGTYYFTSFTDGTIFSAAESPTEGGDCRNGLHLIVHVVDPTTPDTPSVSPSSTPTVSTGPSTDDGVPGVQKPQGVESSAPSLHVSMATCTIVSLLASLLTRR